MACKLLSRSSHKNFGDEHKIRWHIIVSKGRDARSAHNTIQAQYSAVIDKQTDNCVPMGRDIANLPITDNHKKRPTDFFDIMYGRFTF